MKTYRHKVHGWTRRYLGDGSSRVEVIPTDGSGPRLVRFLSAHSWANDPNDSKANEGRDRVVLLDGAPLPEWAQAWLEGVNAKSSANGRAALSAALDDADWHAASRDGW